MNFWFEFLDIHMNEKTITYCDCYGFKWQNINIYPISTNFLAVQRFFGLLDYDYTQKGCIMTPSLTHLKRF